MKFNTLKLALPPENNLINYEKKNEFLDHINHHLKNKKSNLSKSKLSNKDNIDQKFMFYLPRKTYTEGLNFFSKAKEPNLRLQICRSFKNLTSSQKLYIWFRDGLIINPKKSFNKTNIPKYHFKEFRFNYTALNAKKKCNVLNTLKPGKESFFFKNLQKPQGSKFKNYLLQYFNSFPSLNLKQHQFKFKNGRNLPKLKGNFTIPLHSGIDENTLTTTIHQQK